MSRVTQSFSPERPMRCAGSDALLRCVPLKVPMPRLKRRLGRVVPRVGEDEPELAGPAGQPLVLRPRLECLRVVLAVDALDIDEVDGLARRPALLAVARQGHEPVRLAYGAAVFRQVEEEQGQLGGGR